MQITLKTYKISVMKKNLFFNFKGDYYMAFDGVTISALVAEFNDKLLNGRLYKIAQTESDELLLTIKNGKNQYRLLISANASLPLIYLTDKLTAASMASSVIFTL